MLNIIPQLTGFLVARHVKISYSASLDLSNIAFWNGLSIHRDVSTQPKKAGLRSIVLKTGGLSIRLERQFDCLDLWILRDRRAPDVVRDIKGMREALELIREVVENYQSPRRPWWAVVPLDQYRFIHFI